MRLVADNTRYDADLTLSNGRHWQFQSDNGICDVSRSLKGPAGTAIDSSWDSMAPDELLALAEHAIRCARAAKNFHADTVAELRARETEGEA